MTDQADFLREIIAAPDDDAPRLIYADWLEERNDPRGEFIRVQCEKDRTPWHEPRYIELEDRERELFAWSGNLWKDSPLREQEVSWETFDARVLPNPLDDASRWFRRGMAEIGRANRIDRLVENADTLLRQTLLREIGLHALSQSGLQELVESAWGERLRGLYLSAGTYGSRRGFRVVTDSSVSEQLRYLGITDCHFGASSVDALFGAAWPKLRQLHLDAKRFNRPIAPLLVGWSVLTRLEALNLSHNPLGPYFATMFAPGRMSQIHALDLRSCGLNDVSLETLTQAGLNRLTHLGLSFNEVRGPGIAALFRNAALPALRVLSLVKTQFDDAAAVAVAESPALSSLQTLYLGQTQLTGRGVSALARSPYIANLRLLSLLKVAIDDDAVDALVTSPYLNRLEHVIITGTRFSADGRRRLSDRFYKPKPPPSPPLTK